MANRPFEDDLRSRPTGCGSLLVAAIVLIGVAAFLLARGAWR